MDQLMGIRVFRHVVERGTFSEAAERMQMSNASASKYVADLEARLGATLLARTTRRLQLTDAGRHFYERCVRFLDDLDEAEREVVGLQPVPRGLLRVRAPTTLGGAHLGRLLAEYAQLHPQVKVEVTLNDRFLDPADESVDVSLYIGSAAPEAAGAQPLACMARALVASSSYLDAHAPLAEVADLATHNCLLYTRGRRIDEWVFFGNEASVHASAPNEGMSVRDLPPEPQVVRVNGNIRSNNAIALRDAAIAGAGIALLPAFLLSEDMRSGRLQRVLPQYRPESRALYVAYPQPRQPSAKVREFLSLLARRFSFDHTVPTSMR